MTAIPQSVKGHDHQSGIEVTFLLFYCLVRTSIRWVQLSIDRYYSVAHHAVNGFESIPLRLTTHWNNSGSMTS